MMGHATVSLHGTSLDWVVTHTIRVLLNAHFYLGRDFTFKFLDSGIILAQSHPYHLLNPLIISTPKYI